LLQFVSAYPSNQTFVEITQHHKNTDKLCAADYSILRIPLSGKNGQRIATLRN